MREIFFSDDPERYLTYVNCDKKRYKITSITTDGKKMLYNLLKYYDNPDELLEFLISIKDFPGTAEKVIHFLSLIHHYDCLDKFLSYKKNLEYEAWEDKFCLNFNDFKIHLPVIYNSASKYVSILNELDNMKEELELLNTLTALEGTL